MTEWKTRNEALCSLDMEYARQMMPHATNEFVLFAALHKARYECNQIPRQLRHESGAWLKENHFNRMTGEPILPEGELPEGIS